MTMFETIGSSDHARSARRRMSWGGLAETIARQRFPDEATFEAWLEERDMTIIAATLLRLTDRQLYRIGLSRETLALDLDDLRQNAIRSREIGREGLELVHDRRTGLKITAE